MKKLIATVLLILSSGAAYALPVGNPSDASMLCDGLIWDGSCGDCCFSWCDAFSVRIGFYGDYVYNRHMELDRDDADVEDTELYTNAGFVAVNFCDRIDIFATFGATNISFESNSKNFSFTNGAIFNVETVTDFSWSVGIRGSIWECGCTTLGAEAQYFYTRPDVRRVTTIASSSAYPDGVVSAKYEEWQVGVGISHRIYFVVPYIAVKWAGCRLDLDNSRPGSGIVFNNIRLFNLKNAKDFGYAIGASLINCEKESVTVEVRFADEKAVYLNGQARF